MCKRVNGNRGKGGSVKISGTKSAPKGVFSRRPPHKPPKGTGTSNKGKR